MFLSRPRRVERCGHAFNADTDWIRVGYLTLSPLLGTAAASLLFGVALLASGLLSTLTGTLAGQVVMEGSLHVRLSPWVRRLLTRLVAIIPAILVVGVRGSGGVNDLLALSQVVLALQLPFAMFPLLHLTGSKRVMGGKTNPLPLAVLGWASVLLITAMDVWGLPGAMADLLHLFR